jgi:hypothetical protein
LTVPVSASRPESSRLVGLGEHPSDLWSIRRALSHHEPAGGGSMASPVHDFCSDRQYIDGAGMVWQLTT